MGNEIVITVEGLLWLAAAIITVGGATAIHSNPSTVITISFPTFSPPYKFPPLNGMPEIESKKFPETSS